MYFDKEIIKLVSAFKYYIFGLLQYIVISSRIINILSQTNKMKNYNINCIERDILILTGKGDNPFWDKAEVLTDFVSPWDNEKPEKIEFRAIWDTEKIFFCFIKFRDKIQKDL